MMGIKTAATVLFLSTIGFGLAGCDTGEQQTEGLDEQGTFGQQPGGQPDQGTYQQPPGAQPDQGMQQDGEPMQR